MVLPVLAAGIGRLLANLGLAGVKLCDPFEQSVVSSVGLVAWFSKILRRKCAQHATSHILPPS